MTYFPSVIRRENTLMSLKNFPQLIGTLFGESKFPWNCTEYDVKNCKTLKGLKCPSRIIFGICRMALVTFLVIDHEH